MSLTESQNKELTSLCSRLKIKPSIIDQNKSYFENWKNIIHEAFQRLSALQRGYKRYEQRLSKTLEDKLKVTLVDEKAKIVMDRFLELSKLLQMKTQQFSERMDRLGEESEGLDKIPDMQTKTVKMIELAEERGQLDGHLELLDHLCQESQWLRDLLKLYGLLKD